jgi:hypothetical protein
LEDGLVVVEAEEVVAAIVVIVVEVVAAVGGADAVVGAEDVVVAVVSVVEVEEVEVGMVLEEGVLPAAFKKAPHRHTLPASTPWMVPSLTSSPNLTGMLFAVASVTMGSAEGSGWTWAGREAVTASRMASARSPSGRCRQTAARWSPPTMEKRKRRMTEAHIFFFSSRTCTSSSSSS